MTRPAARRPKRPRAVLVGQGGGDGRAARGLTDEVVRHSKGDRPRNVFDRVSLCRADRSEEGALAPQPLLRELVRTAP